MTNIFNFSKIVNESLNEYVDIDYDDVIDNKNGLPIVYQLAFKNRIDNIYKTGYSREYAASAGGNAYCTGVYSTFDFQSTVKNSKTKSSLYGDVIIKLLIATGYDRYFICDEKIAKQVYGDKYSLVDQLEYLFKDYPEKLKQIKDSRFYHSIINTSNYYTSDNVRAFCEVLGGMSRRCDEQLNKYDIRGFVFKGRNDGNVTIIRDFKSLIPVSYSIDNGRTWKTDLFSKDTMNVTVNDYDPIIFLGKDSDKYVHPQSYREINGYMKVQRKEDKKYNLINVKTKSFISPIWFDNLSNMGDDDFATATSVELTEDADVLFYINEDGIYDNKNNRFPDIEWGDL